MADTSTQCLFTWHGPSALWRYTAWVPSEFAVLGKLVRFKERGGEWSHDWTVAAVYNAVATAAIEARSQDYKHTRQASDIQNVPTAVADRMRADR